MLRVMRTPLLLGLLVLAALASVPHASAEQTCVQAACVWPEEGEVCYVRNGEPTTCFGVRANVWVLSCYPLLDEGCQTIHPRPSVEDVCVYESRAPDFEQEFTCVL